MAPRTKVTRALSLTTTTTPATTPLEPPATMKMSGALTTAIHSTIPRRPKVTFTTTGLLNLRMGKFRAATRLRMARLASSTTPMITVKPGPLMMRTGTQSPPMSTP